MTDWRRMEWQFWANVWATRIMCLLVLAWAPEVYEALKYHFPWWDDALGIASVLGVPICKFVQTHTEMYRIDR